MGRGQGVRFNQRRPEPTAGPALRLAPVVRIGWQKSLPIKPPGRLAFERNQKIAKVPASEIENSGVVDDPEYRAPSRDASTIAPVLIDVGRKQVISQVVARRPTRPEHRPHPARRFLFGLGSLRSGARRTHPALHSTSARPMASSTAAGATSAVTGHFTDSHRQHEVNSSSGLSSYPSRAGHGGRCC